MYRPREPSASDPETDRPRSARPDCRHREETVNLTHPNPLLEGVRLWASYYARRFLKQARRANEVQTEVLMAKIRRNRDSDFGRKHRFDAIRSVDDFRAALPVSDYEYVRPYIDRCIAGDVGALFGAGTRIRMYALTSGTHSAPKHIPVTDEFLAEYRMGWRVWGVYTHRDHPGAFVHRILQVTSSWRESYTDLGVPCGSISGLNAYMQPFLMRRRYLPGLILHEVKDPFAKYYLTARLTIGRQISIIMTANPSSILSVVRCVEANAQDLVRDLRDGTLRAGLDIPEPVRQTLERKLRPDRRAAKRLDDILSRKGALLPLDYWPNLAVLANWKGGSVALYLRDYPRYFGPVPIRDIGLLATEGRMTIPLTSEGAGGVLDVASHFFEFIPMDQLDSPNPETLLPAQLQPGACYGIVLTTSSGLYRYNIGDVVRVEGFWEQAPIVTFLSKGRHTSNLTGEKLTESQVVEALTQLARESVSLPDHLLISPQWGVPPRYSVTVESDSAEKVNWVLALKRLDELLGRLNIEYRIKRESGRLAPPSANLVLPGSFARMREEHLQKVGGRREQYKHVYLVPEVDFHRQFVSTGVIQVQDP